MDIKSYIRSIPDYPKPGIMFRDITTLIADPKGFRITVDALVNELAMKNHREFVDKGDVEVALGIFDDLGGLGGADVRGLIDRPDAAVKGRQRIRHRGGCCS